MIYGRKPTIRKIISFPFIFFLMSLILFPPIFPFSSLYAKLIERKVKDKEINISKFAYGLKLLSDKTFLDTSFFLLKSGLETIFHDFARYYIGRNQMLLGIYDGAKKYFLTLTRDTSFPFYKYVLQNLDVISFQEGDRSICEHVEKKEPPSRAIPEIFEVIIFCYLDRIVYLEDRGRLREAGEIREKIKRNLVNYVKNVLDPVDYIDYSDRLNRIDDFSMRIFGSPATQSLPPSDREDIAQFLLERGFYDLALKWTQNDFTKSRIYFALQDYDRALNFAEKLTEKITDSKDLERLYIILIFSYARKKNPDLINFERYAVEYIRRFSGERLAGDLAIKIGIEKYLTGLTSEAYNLFYQASRSPHKDISERAKYILNKIFGLKVSFQPDGFIFLIEKYKEGSSRLKPSDISGPDMVSDDRFSFSFVLTPPSERIEDLYFLKLYLADSRAKQVVRTILNSWNLTEEEKRWLISFGFFKYFAPPHDFRSTFAVYKPPPTAFYEDFLRASREFGIPISLLLSIALIESHFDVSAVSSANAMGVMQIIPSTAKEIFSDWGLPFVKDFLFEPSANILAGAYYLSKLKRMFGSWILAIAAYNAGPSPVRRWIQDNKNLYCSNPEIFLENIPYRQTRFYVMRALSYYLEYAKILKEEINVAELFGCGLDEFESKFK
jgi:tetratricopeptide (TPR) repeat protein